ncbi:MAG: hypothetical protein KJ064_15625 [Anaerolineae bacterium]|nr:hypothetical protein [Anaerolineae bacterium]
MSTYVCDPQAEVIGQNVLALVQSLYARNLDPILEKHGLDRIDPQQWYPLQKLLDVLRDLAIRDSCPTNFVALGTALTETARVPELNELDEVFMFFDDAYQRQHRNGDVGERYVEKVGKNHLKITLDVPYPDDLEYGAAYGLARRFIQPGHHFTLEYDSHVKRRDEGGQKTVLHLRWV